MKPRTLLGVWAHPDDEAYLSAGLMAEARRRGDRVVIITATLGEHGTSDPATWPPARLRRVRRRELRESLAALDVHDVRLLGFEDGTCHQVDGAAAVADHIADVEPDRIVTFGPDGMTGHLDHCAVSRWATDAWAAVCPEIPLWYATKTPEFHAQFGEVNDRIGLWNDQPDPPCTETDRCAASTALTGDLFAAKLAALDAHASQTRPLIDLMGRELYREWVRVESFRLATAVPVGHALMG
jgi:LmbE family N-acetylglucosaminyl deacetylase